MPTGYPGTGHTAKERTDEERAKQRLYARNAYLKKKLAKLSSNNTPVTIAHEEPEPHQGIPTALLTVETIQSHTTALNMTNGTTVGQVVDGYIASLRAAGVKVRTITLALPED